MQREGRPPHQGTGSGEEENRGPPASSAYSGEFYLYSFKVCVALGGPAAAWIGRITTTQH